MTAFGYARVSTDRQADEGESLDVQHDDIGHWCKLKRLDLGEMFTDVGVSGKVPLRERPAGSELARRVSKGDVIVATKLDRAFRNADDALATASWCRDRGVGLHLIDLNGDVLGNGTAKVFFTIIAAFAEFERDRISERQSTAKADARRRGVYLGGKVPFGFTVGEGGVLEPIVAEQAALVAMRALKASGASLRTIAARVEAQAGRRLSPNTLARLLADTPTPVD